MFIDPPGVVDAVRCGFLNRRAIVVGDLMLDRYLWGRVERISPEAPVPVMRLERETETAGGAANVARNLAALGLRVSVAGVTGDDLARSALLRDLAAGGIEHDAVLPAPGRVTTVKSRVVGDHQQMLRIDTEKPEPVTDDEAKYLVALVAERLADADVLVLSDYAKGVLTEVACRSLIDTARRRGIPVVVDPKGRNFSKYQGATLITPNRTELAIVSGIAVADRDALLAAAVSMREKLDLELLVLTLSEQGMVLVDHGGSRQIPAVAREVFDVSGAGDTVIAVFAAGLPAGLDPLDTAHLANLAAGVVVGKVGTASISRDDLMSAIEGEAAVEQAAKICDAQQAGERIREWQAAGERVVFTNGCFDLLHVGHVTYLESARRYGHRLVVGLNTDRSVRALKGPSRPLIGEGDRARVLAALASVDAVVLFDEETPLALIERLRPDVLAKGADYREKDVVGASEVKSWGGQVVLVPLVEDQSTTGIIRNMRRKGIETNRP